MVKEKRQQAKSRFAALAARNDWLVLDTETTGMERKDELVSIAVVSAAGETVLHELIRPTQPISPQAARVHGITAEDVAAASPFPELYPRLAELLTGRLVLAYNANFDRKMLQQTCQRYHLPLIKAEWECVMDLYAAAKGRWSNRYGFTWCKLAEACQREQIEVVDFHEACADAQATQQLVMAVGHKK
ncbi:MAG: 3'-5' exonuclease [Anaerolineae bacterium]|nr:3'-5' exonuclease [Anaerolineae bacterium]